MCADNLLKEGDYKSIRELITRLARLIPDKKIIGELDEKKEIVHYTAKEMCEEMMNLGDGLIAAGLKGKHIAILADNSCRYLLTDICVSSGVGVSVPIDKDAPEELLVTLFNKSDIDVVMCNANLVSKIQSVQKSCPRVKTLITLYKKVDGCRFYPELVEQGKALNAAGKSVYRNIKLDLDEPAKILFTSGTTGANKGVVLTNANLAANIINCMDVIQANEEFVGMSILPFHHATEINTHVMTRIAGGRLTYINDNIRNMMVNMKLYKPHEITIVPMIANAFYRNVWANAEKAGKAEKLKKGIKISNLLRKFGKDKTHDMFKDIYEVFGGNLCMVVCGGSMLNPVTVKGLNDLGMRIENGYGITECGPLISMNADTLKEHLSVGKACPNLKVKIANPDSNGVGDLCVKGDSVFKCYYNDPEATAKVFDSEGYFNTGDSAKISEDGRITLMGRKKNTIVLENGKNICPEEVENVIETNINYAQDIVVYQADFNEKGISQKVLCAGLYIPSENGISKEKVIADIKKINRILPAYKNIDYVELPASEYEKTSTHKIRRATLPEKCSGEGIKIF